MALLKFPSDLSFFNPYIFFLGYDSVYNDNGNLDIENYTSLIALYLPKNHTISDQLTYDTHSGGSAVGALHTYGASYGLVGTSAQFAKEGVRQARRKTAEAVGGIFPGADPAAVLALSRGVVSNPHQFTIFKAPALRSFTFNFEFIPKRQEDVDSMFSIIKEFRVAAYPEGDGFAYKVPKVFMIRVINSVGGMDYIQIPESVCESVSVNYNPTAMSYFKYKNAPAKVNLSLGFKEVRQLTKEKIAQGF